MKGRCGRFLFSLTAALWLSGCTHGPQTASPTVAQQVSPPPSPAPPAPSLPVVAAPPDSALRVQATNEVPQQGLEKYLAFDAEQKDVSVPYGTAQATFTFEVTNISTNDVTINYVQGSCQCTVAQLPSTPWKLPAKASGQFSAFMQMAGTPAGGTKMKTLTVSSDKGFKQLFVKTTVLPAPMTENMRTNNQKIALADRQAVFKGDCIRCHAAPAQDAAGHDRTGQELYAAVCGVCHEAEHQASFVPNLHRLPEPTNPNFWRNWIMHGKQGTLMPAFAKVEGGILSDEQIESLVQYLSATIPSQPVAASQKK